MGKKEFIELKKNEFLMHEGEESSQMYYLESGTLAVMKRKGDQLAQIGTIFSGELVGEMSFIDQDPRCASVKAISPCCLHVIPREKFQDALDSQPKWYSALVKTLIQRLRKANVRIKI